MRYTSDARLGITTYDWALQMLQFICQIFEKIIKYSYSSMGFAVPMVWSEQKDHVAVMAASVWLLYMDLLQGRNILYSTWIQYSLFHQYLTVRTYQYLKNGLWMKKSQALTWTMNLPTTGSQFIHLNFSIYKSKASLHFTVTIKWSSWRPEFSNRPGRALWFQFPRAEPSQHRYQAKFVS